MVEIDKLQHGACLVYHPETGAKLSIELLLKGHDTVSWTTSLTKKLRRLAQRVEKDRPEGNKIKGTNTIVVIKRSQVSDKAKITYENFIVTSGHTKQKLTEYD